MVIASLLAAACEPFNATGGAGGDYKLFVFSGWVQRWNPCQTIHYRVDTRAGGNVQAVWSAISDLSRATGIHFVYDGRTMSIPQPGSTKQTAQLVVAFANPLGRVFGTGHLRGGTQIGYGGFWSYYTTVNGRINSYKITKGYTIIDASFWARASASMRSNVLHHELGHAFGLDHAAYASEVMYPSVSSSSPAYYSAGDLAGFRRVGLMAGCMS